MTGIGRAVLFTLSFLSDGGDWLSISLNGRKLRNTAYNHSVNIVQIFNRPLLKEKTT